MNSLKKQIIYCVLGSLIPIAILGTGDFAADIIIPAILIVAHGPLLVFYVVFNAMKSGKGSEFKE
ncbi:MAG: hypothetical protein LBR56_02130, partial [Sporomusaceae bacterium]|nr:hypothetical protein [Sporomusaceae bacterium]